MRTPAIVVVVGASGSGKTTAVRALEERRLPRVSCHYFDTIGVPSFDQVKREFGSWEGWQAAMTERWLERLTASANGVDVAVLDGATRPSFVFSTARRMRLDAVHAVLIDCSHEVRHQRLKGPRGQPELVNPQMDCWAAYLRGQADALDLPIIDGTGIGVEIVADQLASHVETVRREFRTTAEHAGGG